MPIRAAQMEIPAEEHTEENEMKKSLILSGVVALLIAAASVGVAQTQKEASKTNKGVIYVAAE